MTRSHRPHLIGGDRNQRALREHQHRQFVERVAASLTAPHDRFGEAITVGDLLVWHPPIHPVGQVVALEVLPLEQQPPEASIAVRIVLAFTVPITAAVERPEVSLLKKGHVAQEGETPTPDDSPPAPEDPHGPPA